MAAALAAEDMGAVIAAFRHHPTHGHRPLPQGIVAGWLGITQGQLSRIENGRSRVRNLDTLVRYAQVLRIPPELLWFVVPAAVDDAPQSDQPARLPSGDLLTAAATFPTTAIADHLLTMLGDHAVTDMLTGPRSLIPMIAQQAQFIEQLEAGSRGRARDRLLYARARYSEFLGWLYQDSGDLASAMRWSNTAYDLAQEVDAVQLQSYVQMRKSNIATDGANPRLATALAADALRTSRSLTPRQRAVTLRQMAHSLALTGQADDCRRALDQARDYSTIEESDEARLAGYCTTGYIEMEAAACWVQLGQPDRALTALIDGLIDWEPQNRRDLGLGLARLTTAYAATGQPDEALTTSELALDILGSTRSHRIARQLARTSETLAATGASNHGLQLQHRTRAALR
ncbi:XRE family transcriptional regulator [Nocardia stercoris]|uniref:XRE family transcriptional regulator n=1 Tax=Nocardia stercoris TaxID=2483361 RepID=A0A3M2KUW3_9NOCA|nr:XRE family transcriptional regulator [Nocardia stercoris]